MTNIFFAEFTELITEIHVVVIAYALQTKIDLTTKRWLIQDDYGD
jgi:hypothetical protein